MERVTVTKAARLLGVSRQRVYDLIKTDKLKGDDKSGCYLVDLDSIYDRINNPPKTGRPRKESKKCCGK